MKSKYISSEDSRAYSFLMWAKIFVSEFNASESLCKEVESKELRQGEYSKMAYFLESGGCEKFDRDESRH